MVHACIVVHGTINIYTTLFYKYMKNIKLPEYFDQFHDLLPVVVVDNLVTVEQAFSLINYETHEDDIASIFTDYPDKSSKDLANTVMSFYREHINSVLSIQGVFLANPYTDPLIPIVKILHCVSILATMPLSEILEGDIVEVEDSVDCYFARVIELMSDLSVIYVLSLVESVSPDLIDYLHQDQPVLLLTTDIAVKAEQRFKASPLPKQGVVVDSIRTLGHFGYNANTFMLLHAEAIADLVDRDEVVATRESDFVDIANEIILLVLGSSTPDRLLLSTMLAVSEHVNDNAINTVKVNVIITKYMESQNG